MKKNAEKKREVVFDGATVFLFDRADGRVGLRWREGGKWLRSTRANEAAAVKWAGEKVRELAGSRGRQWIAPGEAEALEVLRRLADRAGFGVVDLVAEVKGAVEVLGGAMRLREAAGYFVQCGPGGVVDLSLYEALGVVRDEYEMGRVATRSTMRTALDGMRRLMVDKRLSEVVRKDVEGFVFEAGRSVRTQRNRLSQAVTFFSRCKVLGFWPDARPLPTAGVKKGRLPDLAPEIFLPSQGRRLLEVVRRDLTRYFPYLVLGGWLGLRPSECLRVRWGAFDFGNTTLHLSHEVVGKTARERWVPMREEVVGALMWFKGLGMMDCGVEDRVCLKRSREAISREARHRKIGWPADVLRHSAITYTLQVLGNDYNKTAEMMGNSPKVIETNYRRPIPAGYGEEWFGILGSFR